jgi:hypothetical protein
MKAWWRSLVAWLAALSSDPSELDREHPMAAAAVSAAYATMAHGDQNPDPAPPPDDKPPSKCACSGRCKAGVYKPDGRIEMRCDASCGCGCGSSSSDSKAQPSN